MTDENAAVRSEAAAPADYHSYNADEEHGLRHNPFKALISPRPIGWISSLFDDGHVNLAPYSYFNAFSDNPPLIGFSSNGRKHSLLNIERTGEFVHNLVSPDQMQQMNVTSATYPSEVSEFSEAGLEMTESDIVGPPRVAGAPAAMECRLVEVRNLTAADGSATTAHLVIGEVVRIHIDKQFIKDGKVDQEAMGLVARLGYFDYSKVENVFAMPRPGAAKS